MKSLHIILLEDNIDDSQNIINIFSKNYSITLVNTLEKAKDVLISSNFDLAILDISIDGKLDGIEFAKHIQNTPTPIPFLFLTSMQSKTVFDQAKLTMPFTYLLKPFNAIEIQYTIELAIEKHFQQENTLRLNKKSVLTADHVFIKKGNKICKVLIEHIEYIEVDDNYCTLFCGNNRYSIKLSLSKVKDLLQDKNFIQIHRKYLVNLNEIKEISLSDNTITLSCGIILTISERYKKQFTKDQTILN